MAAENRLESGFQATEGARRINLSPSAVGGRRRQGKFQQPAKANNFRRNDNKLAYLYLLTPEGAAAKLSLTRAYLARKEAEYLALKSEIETMRTELAAQEGQA